MESSGNYKDLLDPGMRKKKKRKMDRGEFSRYDPEKAKEAEDNASYQSAMDIARRLRGKKR